MTDERWGAEALSVRLGSRLALDAVTYRVPRGAVAAVVGGDGAGKTTLLRALAGRVAPLAGSVSAPPRQEIGFMPTSSGVWRDLTVDENVAFVGASYGLRGGELASRAAELLEAAGLSAARDRLAGQLSGGMRQKLAFTLAMLHRPPLLVLDEPSTGVDPVSRVDLWRLISQAASEGAAVAMATTYLDEAERASSVLVLEAGRELLSGTPDEVLLKVPGVITEREVPVDAANAWRRGRRYHQWSAGEPDDGATPLPYDLEDAVIAVALAHEQGR